MTTHRPPGARLVAAGREADIFDIGRGRILRRHRLTGRTAEAEARVMECARVGGFPVPEVFDVDGPDLVMARVDGESMLTTMLRRPASLPLQGRRLAELHDRLHAIRAPRDLVTPFAAGAGLPGTSSYGVCDDDAGDVLVHVDLHPGNVLIGPDGPVVIDWSCAGRGRAEEDVAVTWLVLVAGPMPGGRVARALAWLGRDLLVRGFLRRIDRAAALSGLAAAGRVRLGNPLALPGELAAIERFLATHGADRPG